MPNHVSHIMTVQGPEEAVSKLLEMLKSNDENRPFYDFDFNKFIPRPASLDVENGSSSHWGLEILRNPEASLVDAGNIISRLFPQVADVLIAHGIAKYKAIIDLFTDHTPTWLTEADQGRLNHYISTGRACIDNMLRHGHPTWYEWSVANWGTKWNAYEVQVEDIETCAFTLHFQTAWSPPQPVLEVLAEKFPELQIVVHYIDEGWGFAGTFSLAEGELTDSPAEDMAAFAAEHFGWSSDEYED